MQMSLQINVITIVLICLCVYSTANAETARLAYGAKAGFNLAQHYAPKISDDEYVVDAGMRPGAVAGLWLDMEILPHFSLGYEALYTMKGSHEQIKVQEIDGEALAKPAVMDVKYHLDYLEIPVLLKVRTWETNKLSLTGIVGTAMSLKLHGHHDLKGTVYIPDGNDFSEVPIREASGLHQVNMFDYSMVYGTLFLYEGKYKLSAEFRFTLGWDYLQLPTFSLAESVELRNQTYSAIIGIEL